MYGWDIVHWRDHPIPMGRPEFETSPNMNTVVLMLWIAISILRTGEAVIFDSGLCVLKGIVEMKKRGFIEVYL